MTCFILKQQIYSKNVLEANAQHESGVSSSMLPYGA